MPVFDIIIYGVLVPAVTAGVILLLAWLRDEEKIVLKTGLPGTAAAFALSPLISFIILITVPELPPIDAEDILIVASVIAGIISLIDGFSPMPRLIRWTARSLLALFFSWSFITPTQEFMYEGMEGYIWFGGLAAIILTCWWVADNYWGTPGPVRPFTLMILSAGMTGTLMLSGSLKFGQMSTALTATIGAAWVVALLRRHARLRIGASGVVAVLLVGLIAGAHRFAELPFAGGALLIAAYFIPVIFDIFDLHERFGTPLAITLEAVAIALLVGAAVLYTWQASPPVETYNPYV